MGNQIVLNVLFYLIYLFSSTTAYPRTENTANLLNRILGTQSSKPLVVFIDFSRKGRTTDFDDLNDVAAEDVMIQDDYFGDSYRSEEREFRGRERDDTYFLSHLLRNVLGEDTSSSAEDSLEPTKHILRSALRARCRKVETCVQKCPPRKPSCPSNCQQVFDELNLCPSPPRNPCNKKPRCGKTLPPSWRF